MFGLVLALAFGQRLELPATIKSDPGVFVTVKPISLDGGSVMYYPLDAGLSVFPSDLLTDKTVLVCVAQRPGKYRVLGYTAKGDKPSAPAVCVVEIGQNAPVPPEPDQPPADIKSDPIYLQLQPIIGGLGSEKTALPKLAGTYSRGVAQIPSCETLGQLNDFMRTTSNQSGIGREAMTVRESLAGVIEKELGTDPEAKLAGGLGDKSKKLFNRISLVLTELAK